MIHVRPLTPADREKIAAWPPYGGDMAQMDYALRAAGWLDELHERSVSLAVDLAGELIGFTMLVPTADSDYEVRIALRGDMTGRGLGGEVMGLTLERGFADPACRRIHLIVRRNNQRGISLYRRLGFVERGELRKKVNGSEVDFLVMDLHRPVEPGTKQGGE